MKLPDLRFKDARSRWTAVAVIIILMVVVVFYSGRYQELKSEAPRGGNLFVFFIINLNVLLLTVLFFLLARNAIKLFYEGRQKVFGYHLRSKLVLIFVGFSLIPTLLLFFVARGFINDSFDYWFHLDVDQTVDRALDVSQDYYDTLGDRTRAIASLVAGQLDTSLEKEVQDGVLEQVRNDHALAMVELFDSSGEFKGRAWDGTSPQDFTGAGNELVTEALAGKTFDAVTAAETGEYLRASAPVTGAGGQGIVVVSIHLDESSRQRAEELVASYRNYTEMRLQKRPIETNYVVYLMVITFLILFSAVWLGFYLARNITVPIGLLAEGAEKVASGDLTVRIETAATDEIGILVDAFNSMTEELETTSRDLEKAYRENEQRRTYIETVLRNVGTGVVSMDMEGRINTFNRAAEVMFGVPAEDLLGAPYDRVLNPEHASLIENILDEVRADGKTRYRAEMPVMVAGNPLILLVNASIIEGADGMAMGTVFVLEDMTRLVNAQKKAAWSEAAKRIAHEIKNPLTPIRLSAERIRRRLSGKLAGKDEQVMADGTESIIREVEGMRGLVDEFSQFARLPVLKPVPGDINSTVRDAISLYGDSGLGGSIELSLASGLPRITHDQEQVRRVLVNLLDNALKAAEALPDQAGVKVSTSLLEEEKVVAVTVADEGPGVPEDLKERIFEPYFSTKEDGTGLGLAIAQRIMEEHGGVIQYGENSPQGTIFTVKIPIDIEPMRSARTDRES
jgi:two-component system nitrogen regulation sensor histidine kinase NtrY